MAPRLYKAGAMVRRQMLNTKSLLSRKDQAVRSTSSSRLLDLALPISVALTAAAPALEPSLTVDAEEGFIVPAVVNGQTLRLRVDPGFAGIPHSRCSRTGWTDGLADRRGDGDWPIRISRETSSVPFRLGGWPESGVSHGMIAMWFQGQTGSPVSPLCPIRMSLCSYGPRARERCAPPL